jgi:hypothetical protein
LSPVPPGKNVKGHCNPSLIQRLIALPSVVDLRDIQRKVSRIELNQPLLWRYADAAHILKIFAKK